MSEFSSLLVYLLTFLGSALLLYAGIRLSSRILRIIALIPPIVIAGLRYNVGTDYASYSRMFETLSQTPFSEYINDMTIEPAFYGLIKLSALISAEPFVLFLLCATITILCSYKAFRNLSTKHIALTYLLYLIIIFPITFNAMRQGVSMSIAFLALSYLINNQGWRFIALTIIASLFHVSAILALPAGLLYIIIQKGLRVKAKKPGRILFRTLGFIIPITIIIPIAFFTLPNIGILEKYIEYGNYVSGVSTTTILFKLSLIAVIIYFFTKIFQKNNNTDKLLVFGLMEVTTIGLWLKSSVLFRLSFLFAPFNLILLTNLIDIFKGKKAQMIIKIAIVLFAITYFYYAYYIAGQAEIIPYRLYPF